MTVYAGDNNDYVFPARGAGGACNQRALNPFVSGKNAADIYLAPNMTNGVNKVWCCPEIPGLPYYDGAQGQWLLGYSYFGGDTHWINSQWSSGTTGYSPVKLSQSHPAWVLTADCINKYVLAGLANANFGIGIPLTVPHRRAGTLYPDGANEGLVDGSVIWVRAEATYEITEFSSTFEHDFFYQSELPTVTFNPIRLHRS